MLHLGRYMRVRVLEPIGVGEFRVDQNFLDRVVFTIGALGVGDFKGVQISGHIYIISTSL